MQATSYSLEDKMYHRENIGDRGLLIHQMRMGVDKPWCGGVVKVKAEKIEGVKASLEKLVGDKYDRKAGAYDDFVYIKGRFYDFFYKQILEYFESLEGSEDIIGEPVLTKASYGYFLSVPRWIEKVKAEHFKEEDNG